MIYVDTIFDAPIPAADAEDTINWWIATAAGEIEYQTGIKIDRKEIEEAFSDQDWLYLSENDDGIEMIDMQITEDCLNDIMYRMIRDIQDEQEEPDWIDGAPNYDKYPGLTTEQVLVMYNID